MCIVEIYFFTTGISKSALGSIAVELFSGFVGELHIFFKF